MIYLDNAATTPIDPKVLEAMMPYLTEQYGNPGGLYKLGRDAHAAVENAREQVARFMGAKPEQIIFTSGATEANNMVFTITKPFLEESGKKSIVTTAIEHQSVLKSVQNLATKSNFDVTYLVPSRTFATLPENFSQSVSEDTGLVSIMYVNNEIGYANDVRLIGKVCQRKGVWFHTDCVQAAGCRPLNMEKMGCDFATISAHKIHGPKGVGALFIKDRERFEPMIRGGDHQEFGMRGGTENVAGIVGFGKACELAMERLTHQEMSRLEDMKRAFLRGMDAKASELGASPVWYLNGRAHISTKTLSIRVPGVDAESLILMADNAGVCISAGSACNSRENLPSHVLTAIGLNATQARSSFRVSFSYMNTEQEVYEAGRIITECIVTLLNMSSNGES